MRSGVAETYRSRVAEHRPFQGYRSHDEWDCWWGNTGRRVRVAVERAVGIAHRPLEDAGTRWLAYLRALPTRGLTSIDIAAAAGQLWDNLTDSFEIFPPDASPTNAGGLLMSWGRDGHHLEIEILADTSYEWFYRHRLADISEGGVATSGDELPPQLTARIKELLE